MPSSEFVHLRLRNANEQSMWMERYSVSSPLLHPEPPEIFHLRHRWCRLNWQGIYYANRSTDSSWFVCFMSITSPFAAHLIDTRLAISFFICFQCCFCFGFVFSCVSIRIAIESETEFTWKSHHAESHFGLDGGWRGDECNIASMNNGRSLRIDIAILFSTAARSLMRFSWFQCNSLDYSLARL